jgi:hypothetical protein
LVIEARPPKLGEAGERRWGGGRKIAAFLFGDLGLAGATPSEQACAADVRRLWFARALFPPQLTGSSFSRGTQLAAAAAGFPAFSAPPALASALLLVRGMETERIDFISAYTDRWLER